MGSFMELRPLRLVQSSMAVAKMVTVVESFGIHYRLARSSLITSTFIQSMGIRWFHQRKFHMMLLVVAPTLVSALLSLWWVLVRKFQQFGNWLNLTMISELRIQLFDTTKSDWQRRMSPVQSSTGTSVDDWESESVPWGKSCHTRE